MYTTIDINSGRSKFTGSSRAAVIDNRDPLKRGRIRVDHPQLGNTTWIDYLRLPFQFDVPGIGDIVYIECDSGFYTHPFAWGNKTKGQDDQPDIPEDFRRDVPTNRGFYTPNGHKIELDDGVATLTDGPEDTNYTTEKRGIRVTSAAGNKIHIIEDTDAGNQYILLQDAGGNLIKLDYKNNELTISSIGKTNINTSTDQSETIGGNLTINVTGNTIINSEGSSLFSGSAITTVGDGGSVTNVDGSIVNLAGGGPGVARLGDRAIGSNSAGIVTSTIIQSSFKVLAG